jgi:hypothetical protein
LSTVRVCAMQLLTSRPGSPRFSGTAPAGLLPKE